MEVERRWLVEAGVDAFEDDGDAEGVYWEPSADCQLLDDMMSPRKMCRGYVVAS
jgi:hypothetical protein